MSTGRSSGGASTASGGMHATGSSSAKPPRAWAMRPTWRATAAIACASRHMSGSTLPCRAWRRRCLRQVPMTKTPHACTTGRGQVRGGPRTPACMPMAEAHLRPECPAAMAGCLLLLLHATRDACTGHSKAFGAPADAPGPQRRSPAPPLPCACRAAPPLQQCAPACGARRRPTA